MKTLVIDSATQACSVALLDDAVLLAGDFAVIGRGHAERLVPMIAALPQHGRADRIAVSLGPGSFTGVRVGLAAARALALAWGAELSGFPTLALIAAMARRDAGPVAVTAAMTGGHGEWFVQRFDSGGGALADAASLRPEDAASACPDNVVAGDKAEALVAARGHGTALNILPDARCFGMIESAWLTASPVPLYGRAPDARLPGAAR